MDSESRKEIGPALFTPVNERVIVFDEKGLPTVTTQPVLTKAHIQSLYFILAARPFVCADPLDPDFGKYDGMTIVEVMVRKQLETAAQTGDTNLIETIMDRLVGKAMTRAENVNVGISYESWLKKQAEIDSSPSELPPIDIELDKSTLDESNIFGDLV